MENFFTVIAFLLLAVGFEVGTSNVRVAEFFFLGAAVAAIVNVVLMEWRHERSVSPFSQRRIR